MSSHCIEKQVAGSKHKGQTIKPQDPPTMTHILRWYSISKISGGSQFVPGDSGHLKKKKRKYFILKKSDHVHSIRENGKTNSMRRWDGGLSCVKWSRKAILEFSKYVFNQDEQSTASMILASSSIANSPWLQNLYHFLYPYQMVKIYLVFLLFFWYNRIDIFTYLKKKDQ